MRKYLNTRYTASIQRKNATNIKREVLFEIHFLGILLNSLYFYVYCIYVYCAETKFEFSFSTHRTFRAIFFYESFVIDISRLIEFLYSLLIFGYHFVCVL